jgi:hypothetical protein
LYWLETRAVDANDRPRHLARRRLDRHTSTPHTTFDDERKAKMEAFLNVGAIALVAVSGCGLIVLAYLWIYSEVSTTAESTGISGANDGPGVGARPGRRTG